MDPHHHLAQKKKIRVTLITASRMGKNLHASPDSKRPLSEDHQCTQGCKSHFLYSLAAFLFPLGLSAIVWALVQWPQRDLQTENGIIFGLSSERENVRFSPTLHHPQVQTIQALKLNQREAFVFQLHLS